MSLGIYTYLQPDVSIFGDLVLHSDTNTHTYGTLLLNKCLYVCIIKLYIKLKGMWVHPICYNHIDWNWIKFCTAVDIRSVITRTNLTRGVWRGRGSKFRFFHGVRCVVVVLGIGLAINTDCTFCASGNRNEYSTVYSSLCQCLDDVITTSQGKSQKFTSYIYIYIYLVTPLAFLCSVTSTLMYDIDFGQVVQCSLTWCASVTKQYNLVLPKGQLCFAAGKVTLGLMENGQPTAGFMT